MNVQWCLADECLLNPTVDLTKLKDIGAFWGSWKTWRSYATDNVICYEQDKARELLENKFNTACNLYVHASLYEELKPRGVRAFGSEFQHEVAHPDEIVALFLAASAADIVLMLGYDLTGADTHDLGYVHQAMLTFPDTQFVLIGKAQELNPKFTELDNLTQDTIDSVVKMLT